MILKVDRVLHLLSRIFPPNEASQSVFPTEQKQPTRHPKAKSGGPSDQRSGGPKVGRDSVQLGLQKIISDKLAGTGTAAPAPVPRRPSVAPGTSHIDPRTGRRRSSRLKMVGNVVRASLGFGTRKQSVGAGAPGGTAAGPTLLPILPAEQEHDEESGETPDGRRQSFLAPLPNLSSRSSILSEDGAFGAGGMPSSKDHGGEGAPPRKMSILATSKKPGFARRQSTVSFGAAGFALAEVKEIEGIGS